MEPYSESPVRPQTRESKHEDQKSLRYPHSNLKKN